MKRHRSTLTKRKRVKYAEIAAVVLVTVALVWVAVTSLNPSPPPEKPKLKAEDYFTFSDLTAEYEPVGNTSEFIRVKTLHLTVTPIGGNATSFHIDPGGLTNPLDYYYPEIRNGTPQDIEVQLQQAVQITKKGSVYPMKIFVYCSEAEGNVTLQIPETSVFPLF
jgi:hypothetical protein